MAQRRYRFDQAPTNVMHDEQLLALVRQTHPNEPLLLPLVAAEESDSVPTSLYRTIDVHRIEQERRAAAAAAPEPEPEAHVPTAETPMVRANPPDGLLAFAATVARMLLLLLITGGLAYLTWKVPARFGLGFRRPATTATTAPARVAPAAAPTSPARVTPAPTRARTVPAAKAR